MIPQEMSVKLKKSLILHEDYRKFPYVDTVGKITIGIGYNLTDRGLKESWINELYEDDVTYLFNKLSEFPWFKDLNVDRKIVLIDMCFMGFKNFLEFRDLINALSIHDYKRAASEMLDSKWAQQVKSRAIELAKAMETGIYCI